MIKVIKNAMNDSDFHALLDLWDVANKMPKFQKWKKYGRFWWVDSEVIEKFFDESINSPTYLSMHFIKDYAGSKIKYTEFCSRNNQDQYYKWAPFHEVSKKRSLTGITSNTKHFYYNTVKDMLYPFNPFAEILWQLKGDNTPKCFEISICHQTENINFESYNVDYSDEEEHPWESYSFGWLNIEKKPVTVKIEQEEITLQPNTLVVSDKVIELAAPSQDLVFSIKFYLTNGTDNLVDHNYDAFVIDEGL